MAANIVAATQTSGGERAWTDFEHIGPGTLAGRFLRTFWHPVHRSQDLSPGRSVPIRLMGEDFTLYRGEGGAAHLLAFRCAHRGTQLSTGWVEGDNLRCFYHGWKYDPSGQCIEQPAEPEPFCEKVRIRSYPAEEYLGLIFVYTGEGDPPPLPRYREFESEDEILEVTIREPWPCNYFNRVENAPDLVHLTFTHYQFGYAIPTKVEAQETEYGVETRAYYPDGQIQQVHFQMPVISQYQVEPYHPAETRWRERLGFRIPIDDESYADVLVTLIHLSGQAKQQYIEQQARRAEQRGNLPSIREMAEKVLSGELHWNDIKDYPILTEVEDYATLVGQGKFADRPNERIGRIDSGVVMIRKLWERELTRIATGKALTQWKRPDRLEVLTAIQ